MESLFDQTMGAKILDQISLSVWYKCYFDDLIEAICLIAKFVYSLLFYDQVNSKRKFGSRSGILVQPSKILGIIIALLKVPLKALKYYSTMIRRGFKWSLKLGTHNSEKHDNDCHELSCR